jgi:hypothetical protein
MNKLWVSIESIAASWSHSGSWAWKRDVALENPGSIKVCSWENHLELEDFPASHVWLPEGRHFGFQLISAHLLWGWKCLPYLVGSCGWPRRCFQGIETNEKKILHREKVPLFKIQHQKLSLDNLYLDNPMPSLGLWWTLGYLRDS